MTLLWPEMLWLLLVVPALVAGYFYLLRRKKDAALRYASLSMVKEAMGPGHRFRRHIPPLLFLIALIVMILAIARPAAADEVMNLRLLAMTALTAWTGLLTGSMTYLLADM